MREARDARLAAPLLLLPSIQTNIRAGKLPPAEANGVTYFKNPGEARDVRGPGPPAVVTRSRSVLSQPRCRYRSAIRGSNHGSCAVGLHGSGGTSQWERPTILPGPASGR